VRKFRVRHQPTSAARSPYRVVEEPSGREVEWVNRFLDRECLRRVATVDGGEKRGHFGGEVVPRPGSLFR